MPGPRNSAGRTSGCDSPHEERTLTIFRRRTRAVAVGHSIADHLVPLFLGFAAQEANDDDRHVIASNATGVGIRRKAVIHQVLANRSQVLLRNYAASNELGDRLGGLAVPYAYQ